MSKKCGDFENITLSNKVTATGNASEFFGRLR